MKTTMRLALLILTAAIALWSAVAAFGTLRRREDPIPAEIYAQYRAKSGRAEYLLRESEGRVAVFRSGQDRPERLTQIETAALRRADRAMLRKGIPAEDSDELLSLLEDLGS
jgi:hypothetical protein